MLQLEIRPESFRKSKGDKSIYIEVAGSGASTRGTQVEQGNSVERDTSHLFN